MARYRYTAKGKRVFPSLGLTVESGQEFDAPDNFIAVGVTKVEVTYTKKETKIKEEPILEPTEEPVVEQSAASDESAGE